jgi:hypothetical protein
MTDIQLLSAVKHNGATMPFDELMNLTKSDIQPDYILTKSRIESLISRELLSGDAKAFSSVHLTPKGRIYLDDALNQMEAQNRQRTDEATEAKRERNAQSRHDWFVSIIGGTIQTVIGTILGALLTLIVQHHF